MSVKYQNVQILRILSCIGVFSVHFGQVLELSGVLRKCTDFGSIGVNVFFIISGFVTFLSLENKNTNIKEYYWSRFIRIVPVYYFVILYNFILHTFILKDVPEDILSLGWLRYVFFLNIFSTKNNDFWSNIGLTWSIFSFILFYILVPVLKKGCKNLYRSVILWIVLYLISFNIKIISLENLHFFVVGIIIYYALKENKEQFTISLCMILIIGHGVVWTEYTTMIRTLLFVVLIIASRGIDIRDNRIKNIINKFDEYTYTIYLTHGISIGLIVIYKTYVPTNWSAGVFLIGIGGTILFSIIIHEVFEKPIQKKMKYVLIHK